LALLLPLLLCAAAARADEVLVSAASSLTNAMNDIGKAYTAAHPGTTVKFNFAASGVLQKQIEQGAPVDVFASASPREIDDLQKEGRIEKGTRFDFAHNSLVLIEPANGALKTWDDLSNAAVKRIAFSDPASVPSGRYAEDTLTRRKLWTSLQPKIVYGVNVRATLSYVAEGNADAGIVFATDARVEPERVKVVTTAVPGADHAPIVYPIAVVTGSPNPAGGRAFALFLKGPEAKKILAGYGFIVPGK
jgi:molybdate transport system substrate-binding protein